MYQNYKDNGIIYHRYPLKIDLDVTDIKSMHGIYGFRFNGEPLYHIPRSSPASNMPDFVRPASGR